MTLLKIDPGIIIWTWITFILVLSILGKATWKIILKGLDARADKIQEDLEEAEKSRENAKKYLASYREKIDNAKAEASAILESARMDANKIRESIINSAHEEAKDTKEKLVQDINKEREEAIIEIRQQAVSIARVMAESILKRNINRDDNEALMKQLMDDIKK